MEGEKKLRLELNLKHRHHLPLTEIPLPITSNLFIPSPLPRCAFQSLLVNLVTQ